MNPEQPPRVRLEWLIATARLVIASSGFVTFAISPLVPSGQLPLDIALGGYVVYSLVVLATVWTPAKFGAGWDVAVHLFDLVAFSILLILTAGESSPFYIYFIFLVICGTLRWQWWGALGTAIVGVGVYGGVSWYAVSTLNVEAFAWNTLVIRSVNLGVVAALVGYLGAYQHRHQHEIGRLVSWSRSIPSDAEALVAQILTGSADILGARRILLAWEEPNGEALNLASLTNGEVTWTKRAHANFGSLVVSGLERENFYAADAADQRGVVVHMADEGLKDRRCCPINAALQQQFDIHAVQSWYLDGDVIHGRLFCLDKPKMRIDDLMFGVVVARQAVSRLDSLHLLNGLREAAAVDERLRLARDLHDSVLQSVAGSALQLLAARRLLAKDLETARRRLEEVQNQLERSELEMRSFIGRLRPLSVVAPMVGAGLRRRLEQLRGRVEREWAIKVTLQIAPAADAWSGALASEVYRIVQEAALNAARHADASAITIKITSAGGPCLEIQDDGRGFPFQGTFDLRTLNEMNRGPLTLRERIAGLSGDLHLRSSDTGTELLIRLPEGTATH